MLAPRQYKTAAELGIGQAVFDGLLAFLDAGEKGLLVEELYDHVVPYIVYYTAPEPPTDLAKPVIFNINFSYALIARRGRCETACCIGGWVAMFVGLEGDPDAIEKLMNTPALAPLFYPGWGEGRPTKGFWDGITALMAMTAVREFLYTGDGRQAWVTAGLEV